jgi:hypothetical protein
MEVAVATRDALPASARPLRAYCPRCRQEVPLVTFDDAARPGAETTSDHVVILPSGEARVCVAPRVPPRRAAARALPSEGR